MVSPEVSSGGCGIFAFEASGEQDAPATSALSTPSRAFQRRVSSKHRPNLGQVGGQFDPLASFDIGSGKDDRCLR